MILHLFPTARTLSGISLVTTEPAPITLHFPTFTPGIMVVPAPINYPPLSVHCHKGCNEERYVHNPQ